MRLPPPLVAADFPTKISYLLYLFLFLFLFSCSPLPASSRVPHNNLTDLESLLAFRDGVSDPDGFLAANWTTDASFCSSWFGVECNDRRPQRVVKIDLRNESLHGTISPHLGNLSFLSYLGLGNNRLAGPIPASIGRLPRLTVLRLNTNSLTGAIPSSIFNMTLLATLDLSWNDLYGPLPSTNSELFSLPQLQKISLAANSLTGSIPSHFARCSLLQIFGLAGNYFSGSIPPELGNLTRTERFYIGSNYLTGKIPTSLGNLTKLNELELAFNNLQGSIPEELGNLPLLGDLHLGNNSLTGSVPVNLLNASNLNFLDLGANQLTGVLPTTPPGKSWPLLNILSMPVNRLTGGLDFVASLHNCRNLEVLDLSYNKLDSIIPHSIGNLSDSLDYLAINNNNIKGEIPAVIGNLSGLTYLLLNDNDLSGEVPSTLSKLKQLQGMSLGGNRLGGSLPAELDRMTSLNALDVSKNALSGSIPYSFGNITTLQHMYLDSNKLFSNIPDSLWNLSRLLTLDLSDNNLEGLLSPLMENLKNLDELNLSKNRLSGNISSSLEELQMLTYLNLSDNTLHGQIPINVKKLINIEYMDLSHNNLSGSIPDSLADLKHLHILNLSFNELEGQIPRGGVFSNLSKQSLEGNVALCGALQLGFPPCTSNVTTSRSENKLYLLKYILPPIAFSAILVLCFYVGFIYRRQRSSSKLESDTHLKEFKIVSYNELARATNNFSDANLLGRGSFGSVFKAQIDDGSITAVKVLNLEDQAALRSFDVECRVLSMVRHRNLVKIINTCSNLDFKALILEFMSNGSLEKWLYSHEKYLNLHQRLNIMVDVSLGLEYLHHDHPDIIVHRDLKPSNVLLDENMTAHVSDFGISKILLGDSNSLMSTSAPGTFGYMAPEYGSTGKASRKSDVYSFGILLLETLMRKKPSEAMFTGGLSLRQWVSEAYPATVLDIVDPDLLTEDYSTQLKPDPLIIAHECLSSLIELGLQCSMNSPKERLMIKEVVPILKKIRMTYLSKSCSDVA